MPGSWDAAIKTGVISVVSVFAIALGSIVFAAFQGHAFESDVAEYEEKNNERVKTLEEKFADHLVKFEDERRKQARFRGEVSATLKLILKQQARNRAASRPEAIGG